MAWFITANIITVFLVVQSQLNSPVYSGTCASIGYSTKCCPPAQQVETCKASDGNYCRCDAQCHIAHRMDCCEDVFCMSKPRTCQDIGCCNNDSVDISERCNAVFLYDENGNLGNAQQCSTFTDCRKFIDTAQSCTEAKLDPGLCKWQIRPMRLTCRVNRGNCYCDPYCACFNDCCEDVQEDVTDTYFTLVKCMMMYSRFEEELKEQGNDSKTDYSTIQTEHDEAYAQFIAAFHARKQNM